MRATAIRGYGGVEQVEHMQVPDPEPGPGEVLVGIEAAALNHLDLWTLSGALGIEVDFPFVLGADGAGEIAGVGPEAEDQAVEQRVSNVGTKVLINPGISCGRCEQCRAGEESRCPDFRLLGRYLPGTFAEFVKVPAKNVFPVPEHLSASQASTMGVTFATAYRMLSTAGRLVQGESVLIPGIGGGLALSLFQLARPVAGSVLVTSSSAEKLKRAVDLGADVAINYKQEDVAERVRDATSGRGVDLVVDSAGGDTIDASLESLRPGGRLVISGATAGREARFNLRRLFGQHLQIIGSTMASRRDFAAMLQAVSEQRIEPIIDRTFPLAQAADALVYLDSQARFGKVVLEI